MKDEDVETIIKRNMHLQMNLAGIKADFIEFLPRKWVDLTYQEQEEIVSSSHSILDAVNRTNWKLKELNT